MWSTKRMQATRFSRVTSRLRDVTRRRVTSALSRGNYKSWHMHVISEVVCGWEKLFFGHWVESCSHRHWCCRSRCCSVVSDVTPVAGHWHATSWLKHSISSSVSLSSYYVLTCVATVLLFGVQPSDSSTPSRFRFSLLTVQYVLCSRVFTSVHSVWWIYCCCWFYAVWTWNSLIPSPSRKSKQSLQHTASRIFKNFSSCAEAWYYFYTASFNRSFLNRFWIILLG